MRMQAGGLISENLAHCLSAPTVGQLMGLCEENYRLLDRLVPELAQLEGSWVSADATGPDLLIEIQEQCRFTTQMRLTHLFTPLSERVAAELSDSVVVSDEAAARMATGNPPGIIDHPPFPKDKPGWRSEPDAQLRVYHDATQVEVLALRQTALPIFNHYQSPALVAKWRANLFVGKWLTYCLSRGHAFLASGHPAAESHLKTLCPS